MSDDQEGDPVMVTVYGTANCFQCTATQRRLQQRGIEAQVLDVRQDAAADREARRLAEQIGARQLPVVAADGRVWSGYRPDQIDAVARERQEREMDMSRTMDRDREAVRA
ncbi:glutaredoxin family protein [Actinomyces sp. 432]|uniref:glutaredoxin family protein n=1 Tax=Actinomyces sp. 432 TaxID=2057798 RepID=UPI00192A291E|nr:glutaredoxin family protein [Actinomyces sp. 432]